MYKEILQENFLVLIALIAFSFYILSHNESDQFSFYAFGAFSFFFFLLKVVLGGALSFNLVTIPSFFMLIFFLLTPYGVMENYFSLQGGIKEVYLLAMLSPMVTFPLGVGLANLINYSRIKSSMKFVKEVSLNSDLDRFFFKKIPFIVLFLLVPTLVFSLSFYDNIPLVDYFYSINILDSRLTLSDNTPRAAQFLFETLRRVVMPFFSVFLFLFSFERVEYRKWFYLVLILSIIASLSTLDRATIVALIVMLALASIVAKRNSLVRGVFSLKFLLLVALALAFGGVVGVLQYQEGFLYVEFLRSTMHILLDRIMLDSTNMALIAFETYNSDTTFLYGENIRLLSIFPGFDYIPSSGQGVDSPVAPVGFIGDLWRNFSWPGVVLAPIAMGFFYQTIQLVVFVRKSQLIMSAYIVMIVGITTVFHGSIFGVMSIATVLLALFLAILIKRLTVKQQEKK